MKTALLLDNSEVQLNLMSGYSVIFSECGFSNGKFRTPEAVLKYTRPSINGTVPIPQIFGRPRLPGFTFVFTNGDRLKLLPQNSEKNSKSGIAARAGHKIAWAITMDNRYVGCIEDGVLRKL